MSLQSRRVKCAVRPESHRSVHARSRSAHLKAAFSRYRVMGVSLWLLLAAFAAPLHAATPSPPPAEPASCKVVRLSDIGWTDVTATTALVTALVRYLGYDPKVTVLSVPVTYASMKNKDIDVFLGNWMPTMEGDRKAYAADGSIDIIGPNLTGAKYTLAVPAYTYVAGLH